LCRLAELLSWTADRRFDARPVARAVVVLGLGVLSEVVLTFSRATTVFKRPRRPGQLAHVGARRTILSLSLSVKPHGDLLEELGFPFRRTGIDGRRDVSRE
jgi:hypothetical protein